MDFYITENIADRCGINDLSGDINAMMAEVEAQLGSKGNGVHAISIGPLVNKSERVWIGCDMGGNNWTRTTCWCTVQFSDGTSEAYSFLITDKPDDNPNHISDIIGLGMPEVFTDEYLLGRTRADIKFILEAISKKLNSLIEELVNEVEHDEEIEAAEREVEEAQQKLNRLKGLA